MPTVTVAACQLAPDVAARHDPAAAVAAVREAAAAGARLVVLPELAVSGYGFTSPEEARSAAETTDGPTVSAMRAVSAELDLVVICGLPVRAGAQVFNSAVVVEAGKLLGCYRKVHLWGDEPDFFAAASAPPLVVDTSLGRVAVMICYDLEFPEWVRLATEAGADLIAAPANWPLFARPAGAHAVEVPKAQAAAATYAVNVVVADRCGTERGVDWVGGSLICGADGYLRAGPATEPGGVAAPALLVAELDLATARDKMIGERNHALRDRRPDLYG